MWVIHLFRFSYAQMLGDPVIYVWKSSPLRESTVHKRRQVASAQLKHKQRSLPNPQNQSFSQSTGSVLPSSLPYFALSTRGLEQTIRAQHLSPIGKTCRWCQFSASKFGTELLGFLSTVESSHLESKVAPGSKSSMRLVVGNLAESHVGQDLTPSSKVSMLAL